MNENGERFAELCVSNILVIRGSIFLHKKIFKATWVSPDHTTENQIDHVCISKKCRRSLQDVRVKRGAGVASDHHLLVARVRLKLKKNWTGKATSRQRYDIYSLQKNATELQSFKITLSNRFQALQKEDNIQTSWKAIKYAVISTCQDVLGTVKHHHKEWISTETLTRIEERRARKATVNNSRTRAEKAKAQEEYSEANKNVKRSVKADKTNCMEGMADEAEQAANQGNMRELYTTIRKIWQT